MKTNELYSGETIHLPVKYWRSTARKRDALPPPNSFELCMLASARTRSMLCDMYSTYTFNVQNVFAICISGFMALKGKRFEKKTVDLNECVYTYLYRMSGGTCVQKFSI